MNKYQLVWSKEQRDRQTEFAYGENSENKTIRYLFFSSSKLVNS